MQFRTENEIFIQLMYTYSYLHSGVFLTIISLLFMQHILYGMTKLYITNDLIHPKLHLSSRSACIT